MFLDFRTDGAIVHQRAVLDHLRAVIDRNFRGLKEAMGIDVADAQFAYLTGSAADWRLMTLAAGLGIVERPKAIGSDMLHLLEELLVGLAPVRIGKAVALVIESGERFRRLCRGLSTRIDATQDRACENEEPQGRKLHRTLLLGPEGFGPN